MAGYDVSPGKSPATWAYVAGAVMMILGALALAAPIIATLAFSAFFGALLLVGGVFQGIHSARLPAEYRKVSQFVLGALFAIVGILILRDPLRGAAGLTTAAALFLLLGAFSKAALAAELRPHRSWGWMAASAAVSLVLGALILIMFPVSSLVVPGVFLGVDLVIYGATVIQLAAAIQRSLPRAPRTRITDEERRAA